MAADRSPRATRDPLEESVAPTFASPSESKRPQDRSLAQTSNAPGRNPTGTALAERPADGGTGYREASNILGLSARTLQKWRLQGNGPRFVKLGHAVRYDPVELDRFIDGARRRSTSEAGADQANDRRRGLRASRMRARAAARISNRLHHATVASAALLMASAVYGSSLLELRVNWTSSAPLGLYREVAGPPRRGDLALVCLPSGLARLGRSRGYLWAGSCPGGSSPILKQVVALPGDVVDVKLRSFAVNGRVLDRSELHDVDSLRRPLEHVTFGHRDVFDGEAWIFGVRRDRSCGSRYFGPIPTSSIVGVARPLLTLDTGTTQ